MYDSACVYDSVFVLFTTSCKYSIYKHIMHTNMYNEPNNYNVEKT